MPINNLTLLLCCMLLCYSRSERKCSVNYTTWKPGT